VDYPVLLHTPIELELSSTLYLTNDEFYEFFGKVFIEATIGIPRD